MFIFSPNQTCLEHARAISYSQFGSCLPFQLRLWIFKTPAWIQLPKWECILKSLHSPHLWKYVSLSNTFFWLHVSLHFTLSHEPNVRVVTFFLLFYEWFELCPIKLHGIILWCKCCWWKRHNMCKILKDYCQLSTFLLSTFKKLVITTNNFNNCLTQCGRIWHGE
jgi:hypothetical protein